MTALRKLIQVLLAICLLILWTCNVDATLQWTMIEFFSGKGNVSKAFRRSGRHRVASFELNDSASMNMNTAPGFAPLSSKLGFPRPNAKASDPLDASIHAGRIPPFGASLLVLD